MLGGERIAVHLISDQGVRLEARDRKILDISVDANSVEFAEIRAIGPNVFGARRHPTIGKQVGESDAAPGDVADAPRRSRSLNRSVSGRSTRPSIVSDHCSRSRRGTPR
jgi:hypothetical protein